jgi:hypothetical protein
VLTIVGAKGAFMEEKMIMPNLNFIRGNLPHEHLLIESWHKCWYDPKKNIASVLLWIDNTAHLAFVLWNHYALKKMGKYEETLLAAYIGTQTNHSNRSMSEIRMMFNLADTEKLRAAGEPIPEQESFTLYRGVSGRTCKRRVNAFSWTESPNTAAWFAMRFNLEDPAVFAVTVPRDSILARCTERKESEYLLKLPLPIKPKRLKIMPEAYLPRDKEKTTF